MSIPTTTEAWQVNLGESSFDGLKFNKDFKLAEVGDNDVLVKFHAASLNYRDLIIPLVRLFPLVPSTHLETGRKVY